ncbi:MAG: hypothetical protein Q8P22_04645 [Chloroflexota bacterium]|nr:hypothetical protein [Chloroflexota bacterium]
MSQEDAASPALAEQIVVQAFEALAQHNEFDAETIARLRELAKSSGLTEWERVVSALGAEEGK